MQTFSAGQHTSPRTTPLPAPGQTGSQCSGPQPLTPPPQRKLLRTTMLQFSWAVVDLWVQGLVFKTPDNDSGTGLASQHPHC